MSLLLDAFRQTDGRRGAYEAAEMTTYALRADNSGLARFLVENNCLVTAILTRNVAASASDAAFVVDLRKYDGVAIQV